MAITRRLHGHTSAERSLQRVEITKAGGFNR
jgi:hypothetical protein